MRVLVVVIGLAGCGRIGFDATAMLDARVDGIVGLTTGFDDSDFATCPTDLVLVGSASCTGGVLELTPAVSDVMGSVWTAQPYALLPTSTFAFQLAIQFGQEGGGQNGDGMTIGFQAQSATALGLGGGDLGYRGITPSTMIELDTFLNSTPGYSDPDGNHLGVDLDGSIESEATGDPSFIMKDGSVFYVWIDYDGPSTTRSAYADLTTPKPQTPVVTVPEDLTRLGDHAWIGMTSSTGSYYELHHVLSWRLDVTP